jgi:hypothetical protein
LDSPDESEYIGRESGLTISPKQRPWPTNGRRNLPQRLSRANAKDLEPRKGHKKESELQGAGLKPALRVAIVAL